MIDHRTAQVGPTLGPMGDSAPLEDRRGVDVGQIREQLRLPVKDRVRVMVDAANRMIALQEHARAARATKAE